MSLLNRAIIGDERDQRSASIDFSNAEQTSPNANLTWTGQEYKEALDWVTNTKLAGTTDQLPNLEINFT